MSLTGSTSPRQRRNDRQEQISSKKHANLDRHGGPGRDLRDGTLSVPAIRITREQLRADLRRAAQPKAAAACLSMTTRKGTSEEGKSASSLLCLWSEQYPGAWSLPHVLHPQAPRHGIFRRLARGGVETRRLYLSGLWRSRSTQALNYSASPPAGRVSAFSHDLPLPEMPCQGGAHPNGAF